MKIVRFSLDLVLSDSDNVEAIKEILKSKVSDVGEGDVVSTRIIYDRGMVDNFNLLDPDETVHIKKVTDSYTTPTNRTTSSGLSSLPF